MPCALCRKIILRRDKVKDSLNKRLQCLAISALNTDWPSTWSTSIKTTAEKATSHMPYRADSHKRNPYVLYCSRFSGILKKRERKTHIWPCCTGAASHRIYMTTWWVVDAISSCYPSSRKEKMTLWKCQPQQPSHALHPQSKTRCSPGCV